MQASPSLTGSRAEARHERARNSNALSIKKCRASSYISRRSDKRRLFQFQKRGQQELRLSIIEIRPFRNGWKCFEAPGVEPVFLDQAQAIDYAIGRACFRSGEIRVMDFAGNVERTIPFSEAERKL